MFISETMLKSMHPLVLYGRSILFGLPELSLSNNNSNVHYREWSVRSSGGVMVSPENYSKGLYSKKERK